MAHDPLRVYRRKRDFDRTSEPDGKPSCPDRPLPIFVVQKHAASHLHYDFRLESGGVLKSWAVPKGPSLDPADKRLAVATEDHPLEYAEFEGRIAEGNYGAGEVRIWDRGTYLNLLDPARRDLEPGLRAGKIEVRLQGRKLKGAFALVRMRGPGGKNWLLIKKKDEPAAAARPRRK